MRIGCPFGRTRSSRISAAMTPATQSRVKPRKPGLSPLCRRSMPRATPMPQADADMDGEDSDQGQHAGEKRLRRQRLLEGPELVSGERVADRAEQLEQADSDEDGDDRQQHQHVPAPLL